MQSLTLLQSILLYSLPAILAITVHEASHGYAARHFGDKTAEVVGRLTLNPIKHIDPVGTILVPLGLLVLAKTAGTPPILFGWAKPVPVGVRNLRNPRRDMALVAAAGPASNIAMAAGWTLVMVIAAMMMGTLPVALLLMQMAQFGVIFNVVLAVLNMMPIPPLDGGRVVSGLLPPRTAMSFDRIEPFGLVIILLLLSTGVLGQIIYPIINVVAGFFFGIVGL